MSPIRSACAASLVVAVLALIACGGGGDGTDGATAVAIPPATGIPVTPRTSGTTLGLHGIAWDGTQFVVVADSGGLVTSPDGATWTSLFNNPNAPCFLTCGRALNDVVWTGTQFVAVGGRGSIVTSPSGSGWQSRAIGGTTADLFAIVKAGSLLVAVGGNPLIGGTSLVSADGGATWTAYSTGDTDILRGVAWSGTRFVASGDNRLFTSTDGARWTAKFLDGGGNSVVWSGTKFVVVGSNGLGGPVLTSSDGISWAAHSIPSTNLLYGVAWSGTEFLAVGQNGAMLSSPDGTTWTSQGSATAQSLSHVAWFPTTKFVMTGANGTVITSP